MGRNGSGSEIKGSYANVDVYADEAAGGLVGESSDNSTITHSYAAGSTDSDSAAGETGGIAGNLDLTGRIQYSYAVGPVASVSGGRGGLVGAITGQPTITASYWDGALTGRTGSDGGGSQKTTSELQSPTTNEGIYAAWGTDRWDFVDGNHFPLLKADWDATAGSTWQEFGNQDPEPSFDDDATVADVTLTQDVAYTAGVALPEADGGNGKLTYSMSTLPAGLTFTASTRIIGGTPTAFQAKTATTYTVTDTDIDTVADDKITFTLGIAPPATTLTATSCNASVALSWTEITGVNGWEYQQGTGDWSLITTRADTTSHLVPSLTNSIAYSFKVRAFVGTGDTKVDGAASAAATATPSSSASCDETPVLPDIDDQLYTQGVTIAGTGFELPVATGGDGDGYTYALTPDVSSNESGLSFDASTRTLSGTPSTPKAKITYTYTATETNDPNQPNEFATKTFTIGVKPMKPADFAATAGNAEVALTWTAIPGVSRWYYNQAPSTNWDLVTGSDDTTNSYTVTGLTNGTAYTFKVVAVVGPLNDEVFGLESGVLTATPSDDLVPTVPTVADKLYTQGVAITDFTLPAATGGDSPGSYTYTLTPAAPAGLTYTTSTRTLSGTPTAPSAKATYTYAATETSDPDVSPESGETTFTIGVHPRKPLNFTATPGNAEVMLSWTAISGVDGWLIQIDGGNWFTIPNSDATTNSYTRTTGLTNGTEYTFKVAAYVGTGDAEVLGVVSDAATATPAVVTVSGKTSTPSGVTVTGGARSLTVSWSWTDGSNGACPLNDGAGQPSGFELQYRQTGAVWRFPLTADPPNDATNGGFELNDESKRSFTIEAGARGADWPEQNGVALTNGTEYEVRLIAYSDDEDSCAELYSDYSATKSATPMTSDLVPALADIADQTYTQGAAVDFALPAATGGDGHPNYTYTLTPDMSLIGLTFTESTHKLTGTPSTPKAKATYTYTATETSAADSSPDSASKTFTIGVQPMKPASFTATGGNTAATLNWTAIAGRRRLGVPAGQRNVDDSPQQQRVHKQLHHNQPHQRDGVQLQGTRRGGQRRHAGQRRGVRRRDGDACG